jgi:PAS domain S-box-containing protein
MSAVGLTSFPGEGFDPALLSDMLEKMVGGAYVCRVPDGALLWYNDAAAEIWGIRPTLPDSEASFLDTLQMFSLEGIPIARRNSSEALVPARAQKTTPENALMVRSDGTRIHVQTRTSLLRNSSGETVAIFHQIDDVSEGRRVEDALRASEERYRQILQSTRDCIKVLDLNGLLISINPEGQERLGISDMSTVQGKQWIDFWHGPERDLARAACATARQGGTGRFEGQHTTMTGELLWWDVSVTPILNSAKEVINLLVISREITSRRLAEDALRQNEKLAAVGRLAASISHEINNPLESVTNLIYLAQHSSHVDEIRRFLHMADEQVKRVSHIVNQTLRFHRVSARAANVDAHDMIDSVLALYRGRLTNASVDVSLRYRGAPTILCYEGNCRQVLSNLIGNAVDAMRTGGRLLLRAQRATDWRSGRTGLKITVADTGHGISAAVRSRLFQPFQTTKGENGTGLGLWISKGIIDRDGGTLRLRSRVISSLNAPESTEHSGTVFVFFLPDEPAPQQHAKAQELVEQWV